MEEDFTLLLPGSHPAAPTVASLCHDALSVSFTWLLRGLDNLETVELVMVTSQTCLASGLRGVRLVDMAGMLITSPNGSALTRSVQSLGVPVIAILLTVAATELLLLD
jgi:hypothetical protein